MAPSLPEHAFSPPPPGETSNFVDPTTLAPIVIGTNAGLLAVSSLLAFLRLIAIVVYRRPVWWDDGVFLVAFIVGVARFITMALMAPLFAHAWDIPGSAVTPSMNKIDFAATMLYESSIYPSKMSILLLYMRVFSVQKFTRLAVWITMVYATLIYVLVTIANSWFRTPPIGQSWAYENLGRFSTVGPIVSILYGFFVLALELAIFVIPIHAIWEIQGSFAWKCRIFAMFFTGSFAVGAAIASAYIRTSGDYDGDMWWSLALIYICCNIDLNISMIIACAPAAMTAVREFCKFYEDKRADSGLQQLIPETSETTSPIQPFVKSMSDVTSEQSSLPPKAYARTYSIGLMLNEDMGAPFEECMNPYLKEFGA